MKAVLAGVLIVLWATLATPARAQTYTANSSASVQTSFPWIDISTTGTALAQGPNEVSNRIDLGFTFTFGATAYTQVRVASNGMLQFGSTSTKAVNGVLPMNGTGTLPNIDAAMLPLWDDLHPNNTENYVYYASSGTAPNRVFVVSWIAIPFHCDNRNGTNCNTRNQTMTTSATFQVQLYEQGHFVYRYGAIDGSGGTHTTAAEYTNPLGATVGYELTDTDYVQYSYRSASVPSNTAILWSRPSVSPGGFNAFEQGTAAGAITGVVRTKVAGSSFAAAVVALNAAKTGVQSTFAGDVKVELMDSSNNSGSLNATTGCRSSWTTVIQTTTLSFAGTDAGRKNVTLMESNAWRDVRLRMSYPASGTATVVACSTDNFAIRPSAFTAFSVTDADWQTAGTARSLVNASASGGAVHKAGRPFTVRATAVNAQATPAVTTNYTGAPTARVSACAGTACTSSFGVLTVSLGAVGGVIANTTATYSEAGSFSLQLTDTSFASVDGADGSTASELTIASPTITVGRFVPDHFMLTVLAAPVLKTFNTTACSARSFTYVGQPFGYVTAPQATVMARNADGTVTANYAGAMWKLSASSVSQTYQPLSPANPGLDVGGVTAPSLSNSANGTGVLAAAGTDLLKFARPAGTPLAPYNAAISLTWTVSDNAEAGVSGNGTITTTAPLTFTDISFDSGKQFRYGLLRLSSNYGSELNNLPAQVEAQYWDGARFATNTFDQCTALPSSSMAMGNYQRNLATCDTAIAATTLTLRSGRGFFTLLRPGQGHGGSVDLSLQLGASATGQTCTTSPGTPTDATAGNLPWLQGKWGNASTYNQNPMARASFGQYRSPLIYLKERF